MHSFHHSRGRIFFDASCALAISASCAGAWMDLGTAAFLPAAAVSALYGLVRLFDLRQPKPAIALAAPAEAAEEGTQGDLLAQVDPGPLLAETIVEAAPAAEETIVVEPAPAPAEKPRKRKTSKKAEQVVSIEPIAPSDPVIDDAISVVEAVEPETPSVEPEPVWPEPDIEEHAPVTPLFEPEPFVRQQRAIFGRKAG